MELGEYIVLPSQNFSAETPIIIGGNFGKPSSNIGKYLRHSTLLSAFIVVIIGGMSAFSLEMHRYLSGNFR